MPAGVVLLRVDATGAFGGPNINSGGTGLTLTAYLLVHPNQVLYAEVGQASTAGGAAGFGGGGAAGTQASGQPGGSGGGATDVRTCWEHAASCPGGITSAQSRLIVAGGGGGNGGTGSGAGIVCGMSGIAGNAGFGGGGGGGYFGGGSGASGQQTCNSGGCFANNSGGGGGGGSSFVTAKAVLHSFGNASAGASVTFTPQVAITTPAYHATYQRNAVVNAAWICGGDVTSCTGTVPNGQPINTATTGKHTFTVQAAVSGKTVAATVTYTVR